MEKDKWLEEKLDSLSTIERAKAPEGAFAKIQQQLSKQKSEPTQPRLGWLAIAAVILLVVSSNLVIISGYLSSPEVATPQNESLYMISDYSLYENE